MAKTFWREQYYSPGKHSRKYGMLENNDLQLKLQKKKTHKGLLTLVNYLVRDETSEGVKWQCLSIYIFKHQA